MAITVNTQDLQNYPGINKTVTVDLTNIVPAGYEGDEQIVLVASTSAYSNATARTTIPNMYITEAKAGWLKSSGLKGSVFTLSSSANTFKIKLDATVSGSDGAGYYTVALGHSNGANLSGDAVAIDMENKIRALSYSMVTADVGFTMAYRNCSVEFNNGRFKIISGSISNSYNGDDRSSVVVASGTSNDCYAMLGFDLPVSSETLSYTDMREALTTVDFTASGTSLMIQTGTSAAIGDAMSITDGTNVEYFVVNNVVGDATLTVTAGAIKRNYTAYKAKVQRLRVQDPENQPVSPFDSIDALARHALKNITSQIDYSA
jgi:hypothetical protein